MSWKDREIKEAQGTIEWLESRYGVLTGSIAGEVMPGKRGGIPGTRKKLLYKKIIEYLAGVDESTPIPERYASWGHEWEAEACEAVAEALELDLIEVGLIISEFSELVGSSLDRLSSDGKTAIEVKCPFNMSSHIKHITEKPVLNLMSDAMSKNYYWQPRMHMLVTGAERCIWATYHPHFEPKKLHYEIIERNEDEMELLKKNCISFISEMRELSKELM